MGCETPLGSLGALVAVEPSNLPYEQDGANDTAAANTRSVCPSGVLRRAITR
jgi:hypothetical protein